MEGRCFQHQPVVSSSANLHALRPTRHRCTWAKAWRGRRPTDAPVGRCQKALERPLRVKGETTEIAVYALRTADIRLQPTGRRSTSNEAEFGALKSHARNQLPRWARLSMGGPPVSPMVRSAAFFHSISNLADSRRPDHQRMSGPTPGVPSRQRSLHDHHH
jgi:hypothetical protein